MITQIASAKKCPFIFSYERAKGEDTQKGETDPSCFFLPPKYPTFPFPSSCVYLYPHLFPDRIQMTCAPNVFWETRYSSICFFPGGNWRLISGLRTVLCLCRFPFVCSHKKLPLFPGRVYVFFSCIPFPPLIRIKLQGSKNPKKQKSEKEEKV